MCYVEKKFQKEYLSSQIVHERKFILSQMSEIHSEHQGRTGLPHTKKTSQRRLDKKFTCTDCMLTFHSFYALRKHKQTRHNSQSQSNVTISGKVDLDTLSWGITGVNNFGKSFAMLNIFFLIRNQLEENSIFSTSL